MPMATVQSEEWRAFVEEVKPLCGGAGLGWQSLFGDSASVLFEITWEGNSREADLEAFPGVIPLGYPWEQLPAEAVPILAAHAVGLAASETTTNDGVSVPTPSIPQPTDPAMPQQGDSVARALNKIGRRIW